MTRIALVSATFGDRVPGHELADPDCPTIPGLTDRYDVKAFFNVNNYGDNPDELMYLVTEDDFDQIPDGFDYMIICFGPTLAQLSDELGAQPHEIISFAGSVWDEIADQLHTDKDEIGENQALPEDLVDEILDVWTISIPLNS